MYMRKGDRYLGYIETEKSLHCTEPKVYRQTTQVKRSKSDLPTKVLTACGTDRRPSMGE